MSKIIEALEKLAEIYADEYGDDTLIQDNANDPAPIHGVIGAISDAAGGRNYVEDDDAEYAVDGEGIWRMKSDGYRESIAIYRVVPKKQFSVDDLEITDDMCIQYTLGDCSEKLAVYPDGKWAVGESVGNEIDPDERPIIVLKCTGRGNLDRSWYARGWAHTDDDGNWVRDEDDTIIGDGGADDMIETCIREGEGFHESLREELEEALEQIREEEKI